MDCLLFSNPRRLSVADHVKSDDENDTNDPSMNDWRPPLFITCGQSLPPALQWLEAEETSDDENDGMCAGLDFHDACTGLTWRTRPADEADDTKVAAEVKTDDPDAKNGWFGTIWDDIFNVCGYRGASPKEQSTSTTVSTFAWI